MGYKQKVLLLISLIIVSGLIGGCNSKVKETSWAVFVVFHISSRTNTPAIRNQYLQDFEKDILCFDEIQGKKKLELDLDKIKIQGGDFLRVDVVPKYSIEKDFPIYSRWKSDPDTHKKKTKKLFEEVGTDTKKFVLETAPSVETSPMDTFQLASKVLTGGKYGAFPNKALVVFSDMIEDRYNFMSESLNNGRIQEIIRRECQEGRLPNFRGLKVWVVAPNVGLSKEKEYEIQNFWLKYFEESGADLERTCYSSSLLNFILSREKLEKEPEESGGCFKKTVVVVPDVTEKPLEEASTIITDKGLQVGKITKKYSVRGSNTVINQDPLPGRKVKLENKIDLIVSKGEEVRVSEVRVPNVCEMSLEKAEEVIINTGLRVGSKKEEYSDKPEGTVIEQYPSAGISADPGSAVILTVSKWVEIPKVEGKKLSQARSEIPDILKIRIKPTNAQDNWIVKNQEPKCGKLPKGGEIVLKLQQPETEQPPIKKQKTETPSITSTPETKTQILKPEQGTEMSKEQEKTIQPSTLTVPIVIGKEFGEAKRILKGEGFEVATPIEKYENEPRRTVIDQNPKPDTPAKRGDLVTLTIAEWPPVPSVIGSSTVEAGRVIDNTGWYRVGDVSEERSDQPEGRILRQNPEPNTKHPQNRKIYLVISQDEIARVYQKALENFRGRRYSEVTGIFRNLLDRITTENRERYYVSSCWNLILALFILGRYDEVISELTTRDLRKTVYYWYYKGASHCERTSKIIQGAIVLSDSQINGLLSDCEVAIGDLERAYTLRENFGTIRYTDVYFFNREEGIGNTENYLMKAKDLRAKLLRLKEGM